MASSDSTASVSVWQIVGTLVLSGAVLAVIGYFTFDPAAFWAALRRVRPAFLAAAVAMALSRVGFGGWRLSMASQGRLGLESGVRGQLAWYFFANVTPTVIGGGPVAAFYVAKEENLTVGESAAIMFYCMLLNQIWFVAAIPPLIGASLALNLLPAATGIGFWGLMACFAVLFVWGLAYAYFTLVRPRRLVALVAWVLQWPFLRRFREQGLREMRSYYRRARRLGEEPLKFYLKGFGLTALIWLSRYAIVYFVVRGLYLADGLLLFLRSAAMMLVGLVVPTPGGAGGLEGLYVLFIGPLVPSALVAPTLLLWRLLDFYLFIALGSYLFLHHIQAPSAPDPSTAEA